MLRRVAGGRKMLLYTLLSSNNEGVIMQLTQYAFEQPVSCQELAGLLPSGTIMNWRGYRLEIEQRTFYRRGSGEPYIAKQVTFNSGARLYPDIQVRVGVTPEENYSWLSALIEGRQKDAQRHIAAFGDFAQALYNEVIHPSGKRWLSQILEPAAN